MTATADVVVIGGGVVGAACAEALSRRGLRVVLVERFGLASGTSSACQSGVGHGIFADDWDLAFDRAAIDAFHALRDDGLDAGYRVGGAVVACRESEVAPVTSRLPHLNARGFRVDWLDAAALRQEEPNLAHDLAGGALLTDMGQVSPMQLVSELTRRAARRGAHILTYSNVTGIEAAAGRITAVRVGADTIGVQEVVVAAGVWSRDIGRLVGLDIPIWPLKGHVLVSEPLPDLLRHYVVEAEYEVAAASFSAPHLTRDGPIGPPRAAAVLQPLPSGQILIGSSREFAADREVNRERIGQIAQRAARLAPVLGRRRIMRTYAGLRPWTPDGRPIVGRVEQVAGLTVAAGHAGEGNTRSLVTGRIVADIIAGGSPPIDIGPLSPDRFDLAALAA